MCRRGFFKNNMSSKQDILKKIATVVDEFGWDVNLLNGFWIDLDTNIKTTSEGFPPIYFVSKGSPIYCSSVSFPSVNVEYEEVAISVNKFKTQVPIAKTKTDLQLEITGGTAQYLRNMSYLFRSGVSGQLDISTLYNISVMTFPANYNKVDTINFKNCYIKSIGEVSFEQSSTNSFFKCNYTFSVGRIEVT